MPPTDQGFEAEHLAAADLLLRLVDEVELVARDRLAQLVLHHALVAGLGSHRGLEIAICILAFGLGPVKCGIGVVYKAGLVFGIRRIKRDADAGRHQAAADRVPVFLAHRGQHGVGDAAGLKRVGQVRRDDGKLVAAQPGNHLSLTKNAGHAMRNLLQHGVAGAVPVQVVDFLEPVEIKQQQRQVAAFPHPAHRCDFHLEPAGKAAAVGKSGQWIEMGEAQDLLFRLLALPNVADRNDVVRLATVVDAPGDQFDRNACAIAGFQFGLLRLLTEAGHIGRGALVEEIAEQHSVQRRGGHAGQLRHAVIGADNAAAVADDQALHGSVGQTVHTVGLELLAAEAHIDPKCGA